ncbi:hypothetical protein MKW92_010620, partial [Papaver armeniacum]
FIPLVYARSIATLENQLIILEDAKGEQWKVKLAKVEGYLADTYFEVQIFESTGCEKLSFSAKTTNNFTNTNFNNNTNCATTNNSEGKRVKGKGSFGDASRDTNSSSSKKFPAETAGNCSVHEQGSNSTTHSRFDDEIRERRKSENDTANVKMATERASDNHNKEKTVQPATQVECTEVPFYMFDRGSDRQGTSTSPLFDLSNFEAPITKSGTDGAGKTAPVALQKQKSPHPSTDHEMEEQNHVFDEEVVSKNRGNSGFSVDIPIIEVPNSVNDFEMFERNFSVENQDKVPVLADATEEMLALVDIPSVEVPDGVYDLQIREGNCNSKNENEVQVYADATEESQARVLELGGSPLSLEGHEMREQYHVVYEKPGKIGENNVPLIDIPAVAVHDGIHDFEMPERNYNAENEDKIPLAADELSGYCNVIKQPLSTPAVGFCESEMGNLIISNAASFKRPLLVDELNAVVTRFSSSLPHGPSKNLVTMEVKDHQTGMFFFSKLLKVYEVVEKEREKKLKEKQGRRTTFVKAEPEEFEYKACIADALSYKFVSRINFLSPLSPLSSHFFSPPSLRRRTFSPLILSWTRSEESGRGRKPTKRDEKVYQESVSKWVESISENQTTSKKEISRLMSVENASEGLLQLEIKRK